MKTSRRSEDARKLAELTSFLIEHYGSDCPAGAHPVDVAIKLLEPVRYLVIEGKLDKKGTELAARVAEDLEPGEASIVCGCRVQLERAPAGRLRKFAGVS